MAPSIRPTASGAKTQAALTQWQKTEGMEGTGTVNAETLKRMGLLDEATPSNNDSSTEPASTKRTDKTTPAAADDPQALRTAMSIRDDLAGPGSSNYASMTRQILDMSPSQVANLREVYPSIADDASLDGALLSDFASNGDPTSDNDIEALVAVIKGDRTGRASETGAIRDADRLAEAMMGRSGWNPFAGATTDEDTVSAILANRSPAQLKVIAQEFRTQTGESLRGRVISETSGGSNEAQLQAIYRAIMDNAGI